MSICRHSDSGSLSASSPLGPGKPHYNLCGHQLNPDLKFRESPQALLQQWQRIKTSFRLSLTNIKSYKVVSHHNDRVSDFPLTEECAACRSPSQHRRAPEA